VHPGISTQGLNSHDVDKLAQKVREVIASRFVAEEE
jgi:hypothetical protein